jgi:hypothetical protein
MKQILHGILKNATPLKAPEFAILRSIPHLSAITLKIANYCPFQQEDLRGQLLALCVR